MHSPFKFLDSYTREDHDIYFGRNSETEALYTAVFKSKMVLLYGVSGTGKSSLIQCGLANKFQESDWLPVFVRRGRDMLDSLFQSLIQTHIEAPREPKKRTAKSFLKLLQSLYLDHFKPVYLIFDQFEELFIFGNKEERNEFVQLMEALQQSEVQVKVIFSIREEYLAMLTEFEDRLPELFQNRIRVERMHFPQAKEVIQGACQYAKIEIEEGFEEQLLEKLTGGKKELELTYLQVLLDRLWKKSEEGKNGFTLTLLESMGHISDLLGQFLEEQINELEEPEQGLTVLKTFVSVQGTKKQLTFEEIHHGCLSLGKDVKESGIQDLLQRFTDLRILRDKDESGRYELRHDSLAAKIYEKITLAEKELMEVRQFVEQAYQLYEKKGIVLSKDSLDYIAPYRQRMFLKQKIRDFVDASRHYYLRKAKRRRRILTWSISIALVIAIVSGIFIWRDLQASRETARIATAHNLVNQSLDLLQDDPKQAFKTAVDAYNMEPDYLSKRAVMNAFYQGPFERVKVSLRNLQEYAVTEDEKFFVVFREQASSMNLEVYDLSNGNLTTKAKLPKSGLLPYAERWGGKSWLYDSISQNIAVLTLDSILSVVHVKKGLIKQKLYQQRVYSLFDLDHDFCVATGDTIFKYDARGEQTNIYVPEAYIQQSILVDDKKHQYALVEKKENGRQVLELFDADSFVVITSINPKSKFIYNDCSFKGRYTKAGGVGLSLIITKDGGSCRMSVKNNPYFVLNNSRGNSCVILETNTKGNRIAGEIPENTFKSNQNVYLIWDLSCNALEYNILGNVDSSTVIYKVGNLLYFNSKNTKKQVCYYGLNENSAFELFFDFSDLDYSFDKAYPNDSILILYRKSNYLGVFNIKVINTLRKEIISEYDNVKYIMHSDKYIFFQKTDDEDLLYLYKYDGSLQCIYADTFFGSDYEVVSVGYGSFLFNSKINQNLFVVDSNANLFIWRSIKKQNLVYADSYYYFFKIGKTYFSAKSPEHLEIYCYNDFQFPEYSFLSEKRYDFSLYHTIINGNYDSMKIIIPNTDSNTALLYNLNSSYTQSLILGKQKFNNNKKGCRYSYLIKNNKVYMNSRKGFFVFDQSTEDMLFSHNCVKDFVLTEDPKRNLILIDSSCKLFGEDYSHYSEINLPDSLEDDELKVLTTKLHNAGYIVDLKNKLLYKVDADSMVCQKILPLPNPDFGDNNGLSEYQFSFLSDTVLSIAQLDSIWLFNIIDCALYESYNVDIDVVENILPIKTNEEKSLNFIVEGRIYSGEYLRRPKRFMWIGDFCDKNVIRVKNAFEPKISCQFNSFVVDQNFHSEFFDICGNFLFNIEHPTFWQDWNYGGMALNLGYNNHSEFVILWRPGILNKGTREIYHNNPIYLLKLPVTVPRMFEVMQETGLDTTYGFDNIPKNF